MAAPYAATTGLNRTTQETHGPRVIIPFGFQRFDARLGFVREEFRNNIPLFIKHTLRGAESNHLFCFEFNRQLSGDLFRGEVEAFARDGNGNRTHQDNRAAVQLTMNRFFINTANTSAVAIIHAVIHAQRL
ncbi:hypothetical protein D3C87_1512910 [compost metagenome]